MISIDFEKVNYPIVIEIPEDYWVMTTGEDVEVEYNGDN